MYVLCMVIFVIISMHVIIFSDVPKEVKTSIPASSIKHPVVTFSPYVKKCNFFMNEDDPEIDGELC